MPGESASDLFPDQVVIEILTRLAAKPICRFKCVSKRWNGLICHPQFITSSPKWAILDRFIRVPPGPPGPELSSTLPDPPSAGHLSIGPGFGGVDPPDGPSTPVILSGSDGLILFSVSARRDPLEEYKKDKTRFSHRTSEPRLFVCSPITRQWAGLPRPEGSIMDVRNVGLATRRAHGDGPEVGFAVAEYHPIVGSEIASLVVFRSETAEWEARPANYMLGMRIWRPAGTFFFGGTLFWVDVSAGLIAWDGPFSARGEEREREREECRFVPLPHGCARPFHLDGLEHWKMIGVSGGFVQYTEKSDNELKVYRLRGYGDKGSVGEWDLVHKVGLSDIWSGPGPARGHSGKVKVCLGHPFDADVGFFTVEGQMVCVNVADKKVVSRAACPKKGRQKDELFVPVVIPAWPAVIPPRLFALAAKNSGNEFFKKLKFREAIELYSRSITQLPTAVAYANRAATFLKLSRYSEAENDCTEAIKLDGQYMKAYVRRAVARKELGRLEDAMGDAELALKLEPQHEQVKIVSTEIRSLLEQAYAKEGEAKDQIKTVP